MVIPLCACGFLVWAGGVRGRRVEYVTSLAKDELKVDAASPSGYVGGMRRMIVPEHNNDSYSWIIQTQLMLAHREWRVRHIDYENAPFGHEVNAASPYRWWLGLIAWLDHEISGRPPGLSVERAALFADPLLHLLLLVAATIFVAWRFGAFPAALLSIGLAAMFPLAGGFLPGLPDHHALAQICALWSVLLLLGGIGAGSPVRPPAGGGRPETGPGHASPRTWRWFFTAGVMGGFGLWIGVAGQVAILLGIALGALLAAWVGRGDAKEDPAAAPEATPWRAWALGGAATIFVAYLVEYYPAHLGAWQLQAIHPLYGLAWLGGGELLSRAVAWIQRGKPSRGLRDIGVVVLAAAALAALPVVMWKTHNQGFLAADLASSRLTKLPDGAVAASFWDWIIHDGITRTVWATVLPLLLVLPATWMLVRHGTGPGLRTMLAIALGPVLVTFGFACRQLGWWNSLDAMLLVLLVAATAAMRRTARPRLTRWAWSGIVGLILMLGAIQLMPLTGAGMKGSLTEPEAKELTERDLAHWLAKQAGAKGAVVLAPPNETASLCYYGGLSGLATLDSANKDGFVAAVRIASATTAEEALELIRRRGVTHIIIPSWDSYLDEYARWGLGQLEGSFVDGLHHWGLPPWLRPVPYQFPTITGFEGQSVTVLEVVEEQDDATAMSRLAEYFIEMSQLDMAASLGQALRRFPANLGAIVARAQIENARDDASGMAQTVNLIKTRLAGKADRSMPWDRRVSLAIVLARGREADLARAQLTRCLKEIDEEKLRSLTMTTLYRLHVLNKAFGLEIADPRLRELALDLLPADWRTRLDQ